MWYMCTVYFLIKSNPFIGAPNLLSNKMLYWYYCSYVPTPVLVIIDVQPKELGIPTKAYYAVEEVKEVRT